MEYIIARLVEFSGSSDEELRDIAGLGTLYAIYFRLYLILTPFTDFSTQDDNCRVATRQQACPQSLLTSCS